MTLLRAVLKTIPASTALLLALFTAPCLQAIEVTTLLDENGGNPAACSLREAVLTINDGSSFGGCTFIAGDTLVQLGPGNYQLSLDDFGGPSNGGIVDSVDISEPMTIRGRGPGVTAIVPSGAFEEDLLSITRPTGTVTLEGFTLRDAQGPTSSAIAYRSLFGSQLVMRDLVIRNNDGGAAAFTFEDTIGGTASLERVVFEQNTNQAQSARGGGMLCDGGIQFPPSVSLVDVIFRSNSTLGDETAAGGGLFSSDCTLTLTNVTFVDNAASSKGGASFGGGLAVASADIPTGVSLTNVTFFGNSAGTGGGLIQGEFGSSLDVTLSNVTFAGNSASSAGDHLFQDSGSTSLRNVLFGPTPGDDCAAISLTLLGGNMDSDGSCDVERTEPNPELADALASNGGFTPTVALAPGSPSIDAGTNSDCPAADQRGEVRPFDGDGDEVAVCDVGAFEVSNDIFADGFEFGDASAWSVASCPTCR